MSLENFTHIYKDHQADKTLVLLHGTGADEYDLLPLVDELSERYNFLSLRGNVDENGMNRFFARKAMGVFDEESIKSESAKLSAFIRTWTTEYGLETDQLAWLGYSNGANMILAQTFLYPENIRKAVLLHPMLPLQPDKKLDLSGKQLLVTYGKNDQLITAEQSLVAIKTLKSLQAKVSEVSHGGGHEIQSSELMGLRNFL